MSDSMHFYMKFRVHSEYTECSFCRRCGIPVVLCMTTGMSICKECLDSAKWEVEQSLKHAGDMVAGNLNPPKEY